MLLNRNSSWISLIRQLVLYNYSNYILFTMVTLMHNLQSSMHLLNNIIIYEVWTWKCNKLSGVSQQEIDYRLIVHTSNNVFPNAVMFSREPRAPLKCVNSELTILKEWERHNDCSGGQMTTADTRFNFSTGSYPCCVLPLLVIPNLTSCILRRVLNICSMPLNKACRRDQVPPPITWESCDLHHQHYANYLQLLSWENVDQVLM